MGSEEIQPLEGFQCSLGHANGAGIPLRQTVVSLVAPFPHSVVGSPVRPSHVEHQILDEIRFITAVNHGAAALRQLSELQQEQRCGIELQMPPGIVGHHWFTTAAVVFGMQGIQRIEAVFEAFDLPGLTQHRPQQATHQSDHPLFELPGPAVPFTTVAADGEAQGPDALNGVHTVPDPGVAVIPMDRVGGAGGKQTTDRVLALQHHLADGAVQPFDHRLDAAVICGDLC